MECKLSEKLKIKKMELLVENEQVTVSSNSLNVTLLKGEDINENYLKISISDNRNILFYN